MAKIYGLFGSMTGKLADTVMMVRGGVQIARKYQPVVYNPSSLAQLAVRAKLKLLSQLSASLAPVIAIPKKGSVSSRNLFTKANFPFTGFDGVKASISVGDILLTNSVIGLPGISVSRYEEDGIAAALVADASLAWDAIVYTVLSRVSTGELMPVSSMLVAVPGDKGTFPVVLPYTAGEIGVLAYGIRYNDESETVKFDNYMVDAATVVANLVVGRNKDAASFVLSETRGVSLADGVDSAVSDGVPSVSLTLSVINASGQQQPDWGVAAGQGVYTKGSEVTIVATPATGYRFVKWYDATNRTDLATTATFTFKLNETLNIGAIMEVVPA